MDRFYLAGLLAFALLASIFFHPIFGLVIFAIGVVTPIVPAWLGMVTGLSVSRLQRFAYVPFLALALPLGGCVTTDIGTTVSAINGLTITQGQIDSARATYIALYLTPARAYRCTDVTADKKCVPRPICTSGQSFVKDQCATRDAITKLQATTVALSKALDALQAQYDAGNNGGLPAALSAFQTAVSTAAALITTFESA